MAASAFAFFANFFNSFFSRFSRNLHILFTLAGDNRATTRENDKREQIPINAKGAAFMYHNDEMENKTNSPTENEKTAQAGQTQQTYQTHSAPAAPGYGAGHSPYTAQTGPQSPYTPYQQYPQPGQQSSYSWGPQAQQSYYTQSVQLQPKPKKKRGGGKAAAKVLAAIAACAVISLSSVGVFAAMIQNGVVNVQSPEGAEDTAAFTLYKRADSSNTTPTATRGGMSTQEIAQKLIPSVVCVQNYQVRQQSVNMGGFEYFFGGGQGQEDSGELSPAGEGSGIILSEDGYIVTNQHVISGATNLTVVTSDGSTYEAKLIGEDTQTDLAVLKIDTDDKLTPAEFGSSEDLQVTDMVLAIGNPGGLQFNSSVTVGYVSALNRPVTNSETGFMVDCIQTDAAINPGNSGGALVNADGLVVGINSSKIAATEYEGMGFAIPSTVVQPIVSDLIEYGYVKDRPMLGIRGDYVTRALSSYTGLSQGYYVGEAVTENAKASGLQKYDVITAIDGVQVTSEGTIASYIANKKPGDVVTLTIDRALTGQSGLEIQLTLSANTGSSN